jgi:hypothetical protein
MIIIYIKSIEFLINDNRNKASPTIKRMIFDSLAIILIILLPEISSIVITITYSFNNVISQ